MRFMLDSNVLIMAMRQKSVAVVEALLAHEADGICLSSIVAAELHFGAVKSASNKNSRLLDKFLAPFPVLPFDVEVAKTYAKVRHQLEVDRKPIGPNDSLIAAHALHLGLTLVTNDRDEFSRVRGLKWVDWSAL